MENKKFKKKIMGGFDRSEVIDYIDKLQQSPAPEFDEKKYIEEIEHLKSQRDTLAEALEKANEQLRKLSEPISAGKNTIASSIAHSKAHFDTMVSLSEEVRGEMAENLSAVSKDVRDMQKRCAEMRKSFEADSDKLESELAKFRACIDKSSQFFLEGSDTIGKVSQKAESEDSNIKEVLEDGFKILEEVNFQQSSIDSILKKFRKQGK